nr:SLC13 family permease [Salinicoccus sediminis]
MSEGRTRHQISRWLILLSATVLFLAVLFLLPEGIGWPARSTIAIMVYALVLWAFAPIPIGLTAVFVLVLLLLLKPVDIETIFSGFASPAIFLIIGGMMMAIGVNHTLLIRRMTYSLLAVMGKSAKGFLSY